MTGPVTPALVCLDMAGTTVRDDGSVLAAFTAALDAVGIAPASPEWERAQSIVVETMGQSKIEVFTLVTGDPDRAVTANRAFEAAYLEEVEAGRVTAMPGAVDVVTALRADGWKVALTTGFSTATKDAVLSALGWEDLADVALAPAQAGRGRPAPDMLLAAFLATGAGRVQDMVVVGDTPSDLEAGHRAGAGLVVGVLSGTGTTVDLGRAGADAVLTDVTELPALLVGRGATGRVVQEMR